MTVLRKSCRNCTIFKRKCIVQLPKCTRCAQRDLECVYDLEPLNASIEPAKELPEISFDPAFCSSPGYCVMKSIKMCASDVDPAICNAGRKDPLEISRFVYQSVVELFKSRKPAMFIHPKLQLHSKSNYFAAFDETIEEAAGRGSLQQLIQIDFEILPIKESLAALQTLLVYLIKLLFLSGQAEQTNAERFLPILSKWTQSLLASAQARIPANQSPWQTWLFGESVRRTIIMSYVVYLNLYSFKYGYCSNWLFVESLPFDSRAGLWMAESPQAWIAAARVRTGEEVGERLSSLHEFAEDFAGPDRNFCGDSFLALLTLCHNGA